MTLCTALLLPLFCFMRLHKKKKMYANRGCAAELHHLRISYKGFSRTNRLDTPLKQLMLSSSSITVHAHEGLCYWFGINATAYTGDAKVATVLLTHII